MSKRLDKGFDTKTLKPGTDRKVSDLSKTNLLQSILRGLWNQLPIHISIYVFACMTYFMPPDYGYGYGSISLFIFATLAAWVLIARQLRVMELDVHDGSHSAWDCTNRRRNDFWVNWISAVPVLSWVELYRVSHRLHHARYGTEMDPCLRRICESCLNPKYFTSVFDRTLGVLRQLSKYNVEYYKEIGSLSGWVHVRFLAWHTFAIVMPVTILLHYSFEASVLEAFYYSLRAWFCMCVLPSVLVLPIIRIVAESEEHDYDVGKSEFEGTFSNVGFLHRFIFHPNNDGYHIIHHMFPRVPVCNQKKLHDYLMITDEKYRTAKHRQTVFQTTFE